MATDMDKNNILLESGTNELEILEFMISGNSFGINVAKIKELMQYKPEEIKPMPRSNPFIEGVFKPREKLLTVVDLAAYLNLSDAEDSGRDILIIAGFNKMSIAFHIHSVESIHRVSWESIEKPDSTIFGGNEGIITGIAKIKEKVNGKEKDKIISIIDFEKIIFDISPESSLKIDEVVAAEEDQESPHTILIAEDSDVLRHMLVESLNKAGYKNLLVNYDGEDAWNKLQKLKDQYEENIKTNELADLGLSCIITDIEMPRMDGHHLTKKIKDDPILKQIPVIIFSSLIDEAMFEKGKQVQADAQLSKPEIGNLIQVIEELLIDKWG